MGYKIITDSTIDMDHKMIEELGLTVVPLRFTIDGKTYKDKADLSDMPTETFYAKLREGKMSTTSQINADEFTRVFEPVLQGGEDVLYIAFSSGLSGTCQSAEIAKEEAEYDNIYIVDSRSATLGLQLLVRRAVQRVAEGFSAMDIVADLETARTHLRLYAVVDTLKYLHKGGRLSGAVAIAGGLLGIKPVLSLDARGKLGMVDKARGMPGAYVAIFKGIDRCGGIDEAWPVVVGYSGSPKGVGPFACYVTQNLHLQKPMVQAIGTVIGTHAGPGACGIAFFANEPFPGETE